MMPLFIVRNCSRVQFLLRGSSPVVSASVSFGGAAPRALVVVLVHTDLEVAMNTSNEGDYEIEVSVRNA